MATRTGYKITVYLDDNPLSPTYMQTYQEKTLDEETCPIPTDDLVLVSNECEMTLSGYSGYRIATYYNTTTGEYTTERVEDPDCVASSTDEQWVNSGTPYCEVSDKGVNTGYMLQPQVQSNINLENYGETRVNKYKSPDCGSNGCAIWDDIQKQCHIIVVDSNLRFDGTSDVSQIDINPLSSTYNQTRTINRQDNECVNSTNTVFSWVDLGNMCGDNEVLCNNGIQEVSINSYKVSQKYKTIASGNPIPMDEYQVTLNLENDEDCGYIPTQYRWDVVQGQYICDEETYTKYQTLMHMVSYDRGVTWSAVEPIETKRGEVLAYDSYECGKPMERWVENGETVCEDNGDDWKLKIVGASKTVIVPCDESEVLTQNELPSIPNNVSSVDFGNCITQIDCSISTKLGSSENPATVHFGDYVEVIGKAYGSAGILDGLLRYDEDSFDDNLRIINDYAFSSGFNTYSNNTAYLGSKIESIGYKAFRNSNTNLNTLKIDTVTPPSIGTNALYHYDMATSDYKANALNCILVPRGSVDSYRNAWTDYSQYIYSLAEEDTFYRATYSDGTRGWNFSSEGTSGVLPKKMVEASYGGRFIDSITDVYLSNEVTEISNNAFYSCTRLKSLTIPNSVTSIGDSAFFYCTGLTEITIPNSVTSIGDNAFFGCGKITGSLIISDNVTYIGQASFAGCGMSSLHIGSGVTHTNKDCFASCPNLSSVTIAEGVISLGRNIDDGGTFNYCKKLETISIPSTVTSIGDDTFVNCSRLTSINLPNACEYIGYNAFGDCSSLSSVSFGSGDTSIDDRAFENCRKITDLNIGNCTHIGYAAFAGCRRLKTITLNPIKNCEIGVEAFSGCTKLESMTFESTTPPTIDSTSFEGIPSTCKFYVPCSAVNTYRTASVWSSYASQIVGYESCTVYDWEVVPNEYVCDGNDKYEKTKKICSFDGGTTWEDVTPIEYQKGQLIESNTEYCGWIWVNAQDTIASTIGDNTITVESWVRNRKYPKQIRFDKNTPGSGIYCWGYFNKKDGSNFLSMPSSNDNSIKINNISYNLGNPNSLPSYVTYENNILTVDLMSARVYGDVYLHSYEKNFLIGKVDLMF